MKKIQIALFALAMINWCSFAFAVQTDKGISANEDNAVENKREHLDLRKSMIESPLEKAIANIELKTVGPEQPKETDLDPSKGRIEQPLERLVEAATANDIKKLVNEKISNRLRHGDTVSGAEKVDPPNDNPRVEPGMVNWHSDFDSAMAASQRSGKPVLLFHLLGQLDQQFT